MNNLFRWLAGISLVLLVCWIPLWLAVDASTGVTGWEVETVDEEFLAEANAAPSLQEWLDQYGFSIDDDLATQMELAVKPAGFTLKGEQLRFLMVPSERIHESPWGTLIQFNRTAGEELVQSQSIRNIAIILTIISLLGVVFCALAAKFTKKKTDVDTAQNS